MQNLEKFFDHFSMLNLSVWIGIYITGAILTALFWILFGKKLGFDYNENYERTYSNCDDWGSNREFITFSAFIWIIDVPILLVFGIFRFVSDCFTICKKFTHA